MEFSEVEGAAVGAIAALGADPARGGVRAERFVGQGGVLRGDEEGERLLGPLVSGGTFLPELLLADVTAWPALAADPWLRRGKPAEGAFAEAEAATRGRGDFPDF